MSSSSTQSETHRQSRAQPHGSRRAPRCRRLRAYSFDPSCSMRLDTWGVNEITLEVPWEHGLDRGPVGEYFEVVDYDPASQRFYSPVNLNDPYLLAQDGVEPSEGDPRFHQQMVYAVAMSTVSVFEEALGRVALWNPFVPTTPDFERGAYEKRPGRDDLRERFVRRLRIYPHALREANAYYHRRKKALLFGYFLARPADAAAEMPGGFVFTCLSHDVIVHETTHALLDGVRPYFSEPSNPDVLAFHESFADLVALFQHFAAPRALRHQIARARGDLSTETLLSELAVQFGQSVGGRGALRDAVGERDPASGAWRARMPEPARYQTSTSPHERGSALTAAVFDAFLRVYRARTDDLFRIATGGGGVLPEGRLHPDLVERLADEANRAARHFLRMLVRALDYCPPVDITFGDYLRALITADSDLVPDDPLGYRVAVIEGFRRWGIFPAGVHTMSEDALRWEPSSIRLPSLQGLLKRLDVSWDLSTDRDRAYRNDLRNCEKVETAIRKWTRGRQDMGRIPSQFGLALGPDAPRSIPRRRGQPDVPLFRVMSARPARRVTPHNRIETDLIIEIVQRRNGYLDPSDQRAADKLQGGYDPGDPDFLFRGGCTVVIDLRAHELRYVIAKNIQSRERLEQQRGYRSGLAHPATARFYGVDPLSPDDGEPFAAMNRGL